jgi:hypothetical protein
MTKLLTEELIYQKYPWANPVQPDVNAEEGYFCDNKPWEFNQGVLTLIDSMLGEIEQWFTSKNMPIEITIYEIVNVFDRLEVRVFCGYEQVHTILKKYEQLSEEFF